MRRQRKTLFVKENKSPHQDVKFGQLGKFLKGDTNGYKNLSLAGKHACHHTVYISSLVAGGLSASHVQLV
jgi:hypothetical protein